MLYSSVTDKTEMSEIFNAPEHVTGNMLVTFFYTQLICMQGVVIETVPNENFFSYLPFSNQNYMSNTS